MESIIELVGDEHRKQAFRRVLVIRIKVGTLAAAEPESLCFCFDVIARGTIANGARLEIESVRGTGWCPDCRENVPLAGRYGPCPACGNTRVRITAGDELQLAEIEVE